MGILDRFRAGPSRPANPQENLAVPLTPAEAGLVVEALRESDRLRRVRRPDIGGGPGYNRSEAAAIAKAAGIAAALGHPVVPHPVQSLQMHEYALLELQESAPGQRLTRDFERLLTRMQILAGMAAVRRWAVRFDPAIGGMRWVSVPVDVDVPALPAGDTVVAADRRRDDVGHPNVF
jgi:hypothetical protein